jgi:SH3-like domain-containing protein
MLSFRKGFSALVILMALVGNPLMAWAFDFNSVGIDRAVLYDAPSEKAQKLFIAERYYPLEVIVNLESWAKVRDVSGSLAWIQKSSLSQARYVIVTADVADIHQSPDLNSTVVFQAQKDVALELVELTGSNWVKVRHKDGQTGYVQISQIWGV